jgi:hypothetical protein
MSQIGFLQDARGQTTSDVQSWNAFVTDWNFRQSMLIELELDYNKLLSDGQVWREYAMQPSFEYYPSNSIDLFAGVYLTDTKQNETDDTKEIRPLIGFRWNIIKPEKRVFLRLQTKYEYRYFTSTKDEPKDAGRIRIRFDLFIPITQKSYNNDKDLYALIWSEAYINFENSFKEKYQSTFRQYLGLGYRFSYRWRFEMTYVFQAARNSIADEEPDTITSALQLTLKHYLPRSLWKNKSTKSTEQ